ncbi:MAG: EAL domain-containing protein, partial [Alphaproteobacteria bacterium]
IIGLGKSFRATVTAEGVETTEQWATLADEQCDQCQGYLFSRPVALDALQARLESEYASLDQQRIMGELQTRKLV